jgi:hypothetical protein
MGKHRLAFIAFDSAKEKHAVAIADDGRDGEVRYLGEIDNSPDAVSKLVAKLSRQYERLHFCYEAGPTGYGLHRQLTDLGHVCDVIAPTMIPKRSGDRVKTDRRDSVTLVKLLRAGKLRAIWVPILWKLRADGGTPHRSAMARGCCTPRASTRPRSSSCATRGRRPMIALHRWGGGKADREDRQRR